MDQHTPPHVRAPVPVDGVAVMPEPVLKYSDTRYSPEQFPFLCSDWLDDEFQTVVYGAPLRMLGKWEANAFHREAVCLLDEAVGAYDQPEISHKTLRAAHTHIHTWLCFQATRNAPHTTITRAYRFVALELHHAMRVLPAPLLDGDAFTGLDVIRDLVAHGTFNGKEVALRAGEDWDQAIEKQSPLPERHRAHIIRVGTKDWNDKFGRKRTQCNCQPREPAEPKPVNVIPADQVKPKRIRGVENVYRALFNQAHSSSQACTTTIPEPDPKFVEVHPVQISSQIVPDLSS